VLDTESDGSVLPGAVSNSCVGLVDKGYAERGSWGRFLRSGQRCYCSAFRGRLLSQDPEQ